MTDGEIAANGGTTMSDTERSELVESLRAYVPACDPDDSKMIEAAAVEIERLAAERNSEKFRADELLSLIGPDPQKWVDGILKQHRILSENERLTALTAERDKLTARVKQLEAERSGIESLLRSQVEQLTRGLGTARHTERLQREIDAAECTKLIAELDRLTARVRELEAIHRDGATPAALREVGRLEMRVRELEDGIKRAVAVWSDDTIDFGEDSDVMRGILTALLAGKGETK